MSHTAILQRTHANTQQTTGLLTVYKDGEEVFECYSLELPWINNMKRISCIPTGTYDVVPYSSPSKGKVYLLLNVESRSYIEIHTGNYNTDILGCIIIGDELRDINNDNELDVLHSRITFNAMLLEINYQPFTLTILN